MEYLMIFLAVIFIFGIIGKIFPKFGHRVFKWHYVSNIDGFDGASNFAKCDYCGKKVLQDSNGDWF
ncbi:MAG: hypothetical protein ACR2IJ_10515 [Fluviibacter sp.]